MNLVTDDDGRPGLGKEEHLGKKKKREVDQKGTLGETKTNLFFITKKVNNRSGGQRARKRRRGKASSRWSIKQT